MSDLQNYFLNLLLKLYNSDNKNLFLHFYFALSCWYFAFVMRSVYMWSTITLAIVIDISEFFTTSVTSLFTKIN